MSFAMDLMVPTPGRDLIPLSKVAELLLKRPVQYIVIETAATPVCSWFAEAGLAEQQQQPWRAQWCRGLPRIDLHLRMFLGQAPLSWCYKHSLPHHSPHWERPRRPVTKGRAASLRPRPNLLPALLLRRTALRRALSLRLVRGMWCILVAAEPPGASLGLAVAPGGAKPRPQCQQAATRSPFPSGGG